jgi:hypothetical protein
MTRMNNAKPADEMGFKLAITGSVKAIEQTSNMMGNRMCSSSKKNQN